MNYKRLGDYIEPCNEKNIGNKIKLLQGISNRKYFQKAKTNTIGVDLSKYRIVRTGQFAFNRATTRNGDRISIALRFKKDCIVSPSYRIFKSKDENILNSEYLMMWFKRPEFDRYARFRSHGSAHEFFDYDEMCEVTLPIPSIEKQQQIVDEYNTVTNRIQLNEKINTNLEATAQALYKHWFVDFEFPYVTSSGVEMPYKSSGGEMVYNEELDKDIPVGWSVERLSDVVKFSKNRIEVKKLNKSNYISTENMLQNKKGITEASSLPKANSVTKFKPGNILISNIRPYFKKIWLADFIGGCSNDVLCFETSTNQSQYFYYTLEQDSFFEYIMQGAKGTKMPRGDKNWIMNYYLPTSKNDLELKFSSKINSLNNRIYSNRIQSKKLKELQGLLLAKMTQVVAKARLV